VGLVVGRDHLDGQVRRQIQVALWRALVRQSAAGHEGAVRETRLLPCRARQVIATVGVEHLAQFPFQHVLPDQKQDGEGYLAGFRSQVSLRSLLDDLVFNRVLLGGLCFLGRFPQFFLFQHVLIHDAPLLDRQPWDGDILPASKSVSQRRFPGPVAPGRFWVDARPPPSHHDGEFFRRTSCQLVPGRRRTSKLLVLRNRPPRKLPCVPMSSRVASCSAAWPSRQGRFADSNRGPTRRRRLPSSPPPPPRSPSPSAPPSWAAASSPPRKSKTRCTYMASCCPAAASRSCWRPWTGARSATTP